MSSRSLVVDASAVVEVLRRSERGDAVARAMRGCILAAPAHLDAEVLSALGRLVRAGITDGIAVDRALARLTRLPVQRYPIAPLVQRAWALRDNIALGDGLYVACAEMLDAALLTLDARLARSSPVKALEEPAEILSDDDTLAAIRRGLKDVAAGDEVPLDQVRRRDMAKKRP